MDNVHLSELFSDLSTPLIADACLRLKTALRIAAPGIRPLVSDSHIAGRVMPVRHYGSVDIFLEAMGSASRGDILVIDNEGRMDEGCIGDLTALEARACEMAGLVVWGCHRDTVDLARIAFPVFSYGRYPAGPRRLDERHPAALDTAGFGDFLVSKDDVVFADADGVIFTPDRQVDKLLATARTIWEKERQQADKIESGNKLRDQLLFDEYLARRSTDPAYSFRKHLREIGGAIEE